MSPQCRVQLGREPVVHPEPLPAGVLYLIWLGCTSGSPGEEELESVAGERDAGGEILCFASSRRRSGEEMLMRSCLVEISQKKKDAHEH